MVAQHPAEAALKKAAKLKGLHLHKMPGGCYALYRKVGRHTVEPLGAWMHFVDVMRYFGASDRITLRELLHEMALRRRIDSAHK